MKIRNKLESIEIIKDKKLNSFPEKLFKVTDIEDIKLFLSEYPAEYYAVRSKEIVGCKKNNFKVPKDKVLNEIKNFNLFIIYNKCKLIQLCIQFCINRRYHDWQE